MFSYIRPWWSNFKHKKSGTCDDRSSRAWVAPVMRIALPSDGAEEAEDEVELALALSDEEDLVGWITLMSDVAALTESVEASFFVSVCLGVAAVAGAGAAAVGAGADF